MIVRKFYKISWLYIYLESPNHFQEDLKIRNNLRGFLFVQKYISIIHFFPREIRRIKSDNVSPVRKVIARQRMNGWTMQ